MKELGGHEPGRRYAFTAAAALLAMIPASALAQDMTPASDVTRYLLDTGLLLIGGLAGLVAIAGLALRDVGLARTQNAPQVSLRTIGALGVVVFAFWLIGYNLIFTVETGGFLGDFESWAPDDDDPGAAGRSSGAHWFFHATLAALGAGVVSSAISERVRLWPFLFFVAAWAALIYPIVAGWAWGNGYFAAEWSFRDAAGASVVHLSAGAAALAAVNVIGPRNGRYGHGPSRPPVSTALPLSAFGIALAATALFIIILALAGPYSSAEAAVSAGRIAANGLLAVAGGSLAAMILTQTVYKRTGLVSAMTGAVAALVSISADPLSPALWQAAMIGAIGGVIVTVTPPFLDRLRIDDAGFSIPAHLLCGLWGAVIAFWANENIWLPGQLAGAAAIAGFSYLMSYLIWTALRFTIGVRNAPLEETPGEAATR
jgi:Amt family ammonium transporter